MDTVHTAERLDSSPDPTMMGPFIWSSFIRLVAPYYVGPTKSQWLARWDLFIKEKIRDGWNCAEVGADPMYRAKVAEFGIPDIAWK